MPKNIQCPFCKSDIWIQATVSDDDIDIWTEEQNSVDNRSKAEQEAAENA